MVQGVLEKEGGGFIHFEALGDTLRFQCLLPEERENTFQAICDGLVLHMVDGLDARVLVVDRDLDGLYYYSIANGKWQEAVLALPPSGYLAPSLPMKNAPLQKDRPKK